MSARFDLLRPLLDRYKRRFTILDLGAGINHPTLGYEILEAGYDSVVVEIERDWKSTPTLPRQIVLKHDMTLQEIKRLGECEYFDLVLAFNIVHWFENPLEAARIVASLGHIVMIQIPNDDETAAPHVEAMPAVRRFLEGAGEFSGRTSQFEGHPPRDIFTISYAGKLLTRTHMEADELSCVTLVNPDGRSRNIKKSEHFRDWIPGINLWNFCKLGGVNPDVLPMVDALEVPATKHGDIQPWNIVMDGRTLHYVDGGDTWGGDDAEGIERTKAAVRRELCR